MMFAMHIMHTPPLVIQANYAGIPTCMDEVGTKFILFIDLDTRVVTHINV